ncbi:MAG: hypothetical protein LH609_02245 [Rudanella sp.]|nr:hypothetical protein [Rudanella sp.]
MRRFILIAALVGFFIGALANCRTGLEEQTANGNAFAQKTDNTPPRSNENKSNKLYPAYLDFPIDLVLDGEKLNPIVVSMDAFRKDRDIPENKKNIKKYNLELRQDKDSFIVLMLVKRDSNKLYVGGETEDGVDVTFFVSKKDGSVQRTFHK